MKRIKRHSLKIASAISVLVLLFCAILTITANFVDFHGFWGDFSKIIGNPYLSGILYTIGLLIIVFDFQISSSKKRITKDFRCNEILEEAFHEISDYKKIIKSYKEADAKRFVIDNCSHLKIINYSLTYENIEILFDSLKTTFFFNLNFELLGILNNIKNRIPNLTAEKSKIVKYFSTPEITFSNDDAKHYIVDLNFMVNYWCELFNYLGYDNYRFEILHKLYSEIYQKDLPGSYVETQRRWNELEKKYKKLIKKETKRLRKASKK